MARIFVSMVVLNSLFLALSFGLGLNIGDVMARESQGRVSWHMLSGLGALIFSSLAHALVLTYFMGTSRWLEETSTAYQLPSDWSNENRQIKYRTIPALVLAFLMLLAIGGFGAAADPASRIGFTGFLGLSASEIHLFSAILGCGVNLIVQLIEYGAIRRNGELILAVLAEVRRIRMEHGLPG